jgi:GTPase
LRGLFICEEEGAIETIYGKLQGLKPNQLKQLRRLYQERLPIDRLTTPEFSQRLAAISSEIKAPVSAYINRRGHIIRVGVGTPSQTQIPPLELPRYGAERLSGIRCVTTQLKVEPPTDAALMAMALQRLDAMVSLDVISSGFQKRGGGVTGYVQQVYLSHLVAHPDVNWTVSPPLDLDTVSEQDLTELIDNIEREYSREASSRSVDDQVDRVVIVGLKTIAMGDLRFQDGLTELTRLVETAGGEVLQVIKQNRTRPHPQTVVGEGKVQEIALAAQKVGANLIAFDCNLSPSQGRNLETLIGIRIVDRTEVILDIFAQRAQSGAGKLQVELAQLEYQLPRIKGMGLAMSRQGGGIGTRGPGETKLETERRAIQKRIYKLQQDVDQLQAHRSRMRQQRQQQQVPSVALVGYTNAGKSTLLNALTNAEVYAADKLFATLDPTTRRMHVPIDNEGNTSQILLTDTVGFIHELPPSLMDSFRATLEEVTEADALIHLVDLSHPAWHSHIRAVTAILAAMPIAPGPALIVFNKIDQVDEETIANATLEFPRSIFVAAAERKGLETLRYRISQLLS